MLCSNCGENLPESFNFCSKCGFPQHTDESIFPISAIVYLFGDQFSKRARFTGGKVPCTDIKVDFQDLGEKMMAAAFIWLEENGLVTMSFEKGTWHRPFPRRQLIPYNFISVERKTPKYCLQYLTS